MSYRTSFYLGILRHLIWFVLAWINIEVLFLHTSAIASWNKAQMLLLLGVANLGSNLVTFAFRANMERISEAIMHGHMDYILLKPISSQFTATLRYVRIHDLPQAAISLGLIVYALNLMNHRPHLPELAIFVLLFLSGLTMLYAIWLVLATLSFWVVRQAPNISELFDVLYGAARYPKHIFPDALEFIVTFIVPLAFVAMFPAQALSGTIRWTYALIAPVLAFITLYLSHRFWVYGTRFYTSASS
jgi:ABC-2 type transport system permease protein